MADVNGRTTKPAKPTGRTASREVRRQQLIEATIESIAKHGISGTTMTTVTGFAGLSLGIVNFHFQNKQNLFEETLRHLADEHRDQWHKSVHKAELTPVSKLLAIVDANFHPRVCNRKNLSVWYSFFGEAPYRHVYRKIMDEIDAERLNSMRELFERIIEDGQYDDIDAADVANTMEALYDGYSINILIYPEKFSGADAKIRIRDFLANTFPRHFDPPSGKACGT